MAHRLRVLLLAESANPDASSVSLIGWSLSHALAELADVHVVTRSWNRASLSGAGWREGRDFTSIDTSRATGSVVRAGSAIQKAIGLGWTWTTAVSTLAYYRFEGLVWNRFAPDLAAGRFDLVHRITPVSPATPSPIARRCMRAGVPFVWGPLNGGVPWPKGFQDVLRSEGEWLSYVRGLHRLLPGYRSTRASAAATLAGSVTTWDELRRCRDRCVYVPENAIEPDRFARTRDPDPRGPLRVAFAGRLVASKGADMLVEAAAPMVRAGKITIDVIGDGPERRRLEALISARGIGAGVTISGWIAHRAVAERLCRAHVFAFPSVREFGGGVVLEAMALGLPPVVLDYAGPAEIVTDTTGFRIPMGPRASVIERLRETLEALAASPDLARSVGERARRRVYEHYTWSAKARQILDVYAWVLGQRDRPDFGMPFPDAPDAEAAPAYQAVRPAVRASQRANSST